MTAVGAKVKLCLVLSRWASCLWSIWRPCWRAHAKQKDEENELPRAERRELFSRYAKTARERRVGEFVLQIWQACRVWARSSTYQSHSSPIALYTRTIRRPKEREDAPIGRHFEGRCAQKVDWKNGEMVRFVHFHLDRFFPD